MRNSILLLNDFLTESNYLKLMKYFASNDFYNVYKNKKFTKEMNPKIVVQESFFQNDDPETPISFEKELEFINDFLVSGLSNLVENEMNKFIRICYDRGFVTKQLKEGFAREEKDKLEKAKETIRNSSYLPKIIEEKLVYHIEFLNKELTSYVTNPYRKFEKILVAANRIDIELLFYLLVKNGKISASSISNIGKMIDNSFKFKKGYDFESIIDSHKSLNKIEKSRGIEEPLRRLKDLFSNPDFYNV